MEEEVGIRGRPAERGLQLLEASLAPTAMRPHGRLYAAFVYFFGLNFHAACGKLPLTCSPSILSATISPSLATSSPRKKVMTGIPRTFLPSHIE